MSSPTSSSSTTMELSTTVDPFLVDIPQAPLSPYSYSSTSHPLTSSSATLVDPPTSPIGRRPSIKLKFSSSGSDIVNSVVVDASGRSLYSVSSDSRRTVVASCLDNVEVASVEWDRARPRMVFRGKKIKCKDWLPLAGPETDTCRVLTHGDAQLKWKNRSTSGHLVPAGRPGLALARWRIKSHTDALYLEIFQEALVEHGLLEAIVISLVLLQSGQSLGDFDFHSLRLSSSFLV